MHRAFVLALTAACSGSSSTPIDSAPTDEFDRRAMITNIGTKVMVPMHATFAQKAAALPGAISAYCTALDAGTVGTTLDAARTAFGEAIDAWQVADAVLFGPAEMNNKTLRGNIYSWPLVSLCELDKDTASRWADPSSYSVADQLVNARSLSAVEYLLYPPSADHNCGVPPSGWSAVGADLPRARCRLALDLATDVAMQAQTLNTAWSVEGGNFTAEIAATPNAHAAVNVISNSLFYVDKMVKDMKLGESAGIVLNVCNSVQQPCDREVELRYADRATFALRANLAGLHAVFTGSPDPASREGAGFDDFLIQLGHQDVADRMVGNIDAAIAAADALPDSFLSALSTSYSQVVATHAATKAFTDDLKSQFLTLLALEIPDDVATDND